MISLKPQTRVPMNPSEVFYFIGVWEPLPNDRSTEPMSKDHKMTEEEMDAGPLPEWAVGRAYGKFVRGAHLPTRDGRCYGNAHIIDMERSKKFGWDFTVLTDAGMRIHLTSDDIKERFYPPVWVSDVEDVKRKFGRDE